jgi:hypothetical protein
MEVCYSSNQVLILPCNTKLRLITTQHSLKNLFRMKEVKISI